MQRTRKQKRKVRAIVILALVIFAIFLLPTKSSTIAAQSLVNSALSSEQGKDSETAKLLQITNIRLEAANETITLLNERLKEKDAVIAAREGELEARKEQIVDLRTANKERATVNTGDARMLEAANVIITKQDAEINKLRNPGWFASIFDRRTFGGAFIGYGACKLTSGSNPTIQIPNPFQSNALMFQQSASEKAKQAMRLFTK